MLDLHADQILGLLRTARAQWQCDGIERVSAHDDQWRCWFGIGENSECVLGIAMPEDLQATGASSDSADLRFYVQITLPTGEVHGPYMLLSLLAHTDEEVAFAAALFDGLLNLSDDNFEASAEAALGALAAFTSTHANDGAAEEVQCGLFGELVVIANMRSKLAGLESWNGNRFSTYDFSRGSHRLEVKSSMSPIRHAWLSWSQTADNPGEVVTLASLYVPPSSRGIDVVALLDIICSEVPTSLERKARRKLMSVVGESDLHTFDLETAALSTLYWPMHDVPRPQFSDARILRAKWQVRLPDSGRSGDGPDFWQAL